MMMDQPAAATPETTLIASLVRTRAAADRMGPAVDGALGCRSDVSLPLIANPNQPYSADGFNVALSRALLSETLAPGSILAQRKGVLAKVNEATREERDLKRRRADNKLLRTKDHVIPDFTTAEYVSCAVVERLFSLARLNPTHSHSAPRSYETRLKKIAQRGVVRLFNAVAEHQQVKPGADAPVVKAEKISKQSFLKLLKERPADSK